MTIISAAIVNKQGRILLARQFVDIQRTRIEGLLSAFPRLLESSVQKQATFIDADTVRYVYQPLDELFLVLVTSTTSNIVEDLATLHLMGRLVPEYAAAGLTEADLEPYTLQICMTFDEVVVGGKREETSVDDIQTYLLMDSIEEQNAIEAKRQQIENARRINKERARELREKHRAGIFNNTSSNDGSYMGFGSSTLDQTTTPLLGANNNSNNYPEDVGISGYGYDRSGSSGISGPSSARPFTSSTDNTATAANSAQTPSSRQAALPRTAMTLGKSRKTNITSRVQQEMGGVSTTEQQHPSVSEAEERTTTTTAATGFMAGGADSNAHPSQQQHQHHEGVLPPSSLIAAAAARPHEAVHVLIEEKMSAHLSRGGEPVPTEIKGELSVLVKDPAMSSVVLRLSPTSGEFAFRAHTKVNKALFAREHVLAMMENKPLPVNQSVTILRWRQSNPGAIQPPIVFACWPEVGSMTVEYELVNPSVPALEQVIVTIPLHHCQLDHYEASVGTCELTEGALVWHIPYVDGQHNRSGHVELTLPDEGQHAPEQVFFPMAIAFVSVVSVGLVHVEEVVSTQTNAPIRFSQETRLVTDQLTID